jgi:hypothetical protein
MKIINYSKLIIEITILSDNNNQKLGCDGPSGPVP